MTPISLLLDMLDEAYDRQSWHGTNLRGALRGVTPAQAGWRPARDRHNIRDVVMHAAYWKYAVRRRLQGGSRGRFPVKGSNWFAPDPGRAWSREVELLGAEHRALREAVAAVGPAVLDRPLLRNGKTAAHLIRGIAAHDLYHAGQIQLLKRLQRTR